MAQLLLSNALHAPVVSVAVDVGSSGSGTGVGVGQQRPAPTLAVAVGVPLDSKVDATRDEPLCVSEIIKGRLYFATFENGVHPRNDCPQVHYFSTDRAFAYAGFHSDFGPLDLGQVHRYCKQLLALLNQDFRAPWRRVVHYTHCWPDRRANAAFLVASFAVLFLRMTPEQAHQAVLQSTGSLTIPLRPFQDASPGTHSDTGAGRTPRSSRTPRLLPLLDCLRGLRCARMLGFYDPADFDVAEFERCRGLGPADGGGMSWIVPGKLLAFPGPGHGPAHGPEHYAKYFSQHGVSAVVRLNRRTYDARRFTSAGIKHYDLFLTDGSCPSRSLLSAFLHIAENAVGAVAVHCKAGLGRTGSLIGAYIIKHFRMTAMEAIAWMRVCRPGCVIGHQQDWLRHCEAALWSLGDSLRLQLYGKADLIAIPAHGVHSIGAQKEHLTCTVNQSQEKVFDPDRGTAACLTVLGSNTGCRGNDIILLH